MSSQYEINLARGCDGEDLGILRGEMLVIFWLVYLENPPF